MTKLDVSLELPAESSDRDVSVRCLGVVVRQEPVAFGTPPSYQTAILFLFLEPAARRHIAEFVLRSMLVRNGWRS